MQLTGGVAGYQSSEGNYHLASRAIGLNRVKSGSLHLVHDYYGTYPPVPLPLPREGGV